MKKAAIIGFAATLAAMIPLLFLVTRGSVGAGQVALYTAGALLFVAWCALYMIAIDPWLRRWVAN